MIFSSPPIVMQTATEKEEPVGKITKRFLLDNIFDSALFCKSDENTVSAAIAIIHSISIFEIIFV